MISQSVKFSQFDRVTLRTTKNVKYLSAPPDTKLDPNGLWTIAAIVDNELLLVKEAAVLRIPAADVIKHHEHDIAELFSILGRMADG